MIQKCWMLDNENGFLMSPDPITNIRSVSSGLELEVAVELDEIAIKLPKLIASGEIRKTLKDLKVHDMSCLEYVDDFRLVERAFQIYSHLANTYVWCEEKKPENHIPQGVAVPLVKLSEITERPPILTYAMTCLANYERIDPNGEIVVDNLKCIQKVIDIKDESWFHLIHVEIEAHAGNAIYSFQRATDAIAQGDIKKVEAELRKIPNAVEKMMSTFKRIFENCSPDIYYHTLRPYLFGFTDIVFEGVEKFKGQPQSFRGQSGAQSTVIPALQSFLGLLHESGGLSEHLEVMKSYMPKPHQDLLRNIDGQCIRKFVSESNNRQLKDSYNACIESLFNFRSLHLGMAKSFVASKVKNPIGTGGTEFMHWLKQLRDETNQQYVS